MPLLSSECIGRGELPGLLSDHPRKRFERIVFDRPSYRKISSNDPRARGSAIFAQWFDNQADRLGDGNQPEYGKSVSPHDYGQDGGLHTFWHRGQGLHGDPVSVFSFFARLRTSPFEALTRSPTCTNMHMPCPRKLIERSKKREALRDPHGLRRSS